MKKIFLLWSFCRYRSQVDKLSRYTNFTLGGIWEKFDCQTHLLHREALAPIMKNNPLVGPKTICVS